MLDSEAYASCLRAEADLTPAACTENTPETHATHLRVIHGMDEPVTENQSRAEAL